MAMQFSIQKRLARTLAATFMILSIAVSGYALELGIWEISGTVFSALAVVVNSVVEYRYGDNAVYTVSLKRPGLSRLRVPERTTSFAALLAGKRRNLGSAWLDDLRGDPDQGYTLTPGQQRRKALGFLVAAARLRMHDWLGWTWAPIDWVLRTRSRRESFVAAAVGAQAIYIMRSDGLHVLLTYGWAWNTACGGAAWGCTWWLGKKRGIELASDDVSAEK